MGPPLYSRLYIGGHKLIPPLMTDPPAADKHFTLQVFDALAAAVAVVLYNARV